MRHLRHWHPATLHSHRDLSPSVRELTLRPHGGLLPWTAGSHLALAFEAEGREMVRTYSLIGLPPRPDEPALYRIAVRRAEPGHGGSKHLWSLQDGAELRVGEPNNHFELPLGAPAYLLIAGGIGITPLVGMAQALVRHHRPVRLVYAARSASELVYAEPLRAALGDGLSTFAAEAGQRLDIAAAIAALPARGMALVCGPLRLLEAVRAAWAHSGRSPARLRFETFGNSGGAADESFWVELPRHGLRLQVPAERSLLEVLEDAGIATLSDCRRGECGLCAMTVLKVDGRVDHRDVYFSPAQRAEGHSLCACVSRVSGGGVSLDTAYRPD